MGYHALVTIYNGVRQTALRQREILIEKGDYVAAYEVVIPMELTPTMHALFWLRSQEANLNSMA